jgi:AraC-like DNA-binding protein
VFPLAGALAALGVRFRPGALGMLVRANVRGLANIALAPADLPLALDLPLERLAATPSLRLRAARVLAALQPWLRAASWPDPAVAHVLTRWRDAPLGVPLARVAVLARDAGLGERTLERRFATQVGYAPAEFRRLARFRRVLQRRAAGTGEWAACAGLAPEAWAREQQAVGFLQDGQGTLDCHRALNAGRGFAILAGDGIEVMYQTATSVPADLAAPASDRAGNIVVFAEMPADAPAQ